MANTLALSTQLATARLRDPKGTGALDAFALVAYGVAAWLAFVVASGTWMFFRRLEVPSAWLAAQQSGDPGSPSFAELFGSTYVVLALVACALLIVAGQLLGGALLDALAGRLAASDLLGILLVLAGAALQRWQASKPRS